jgi:hypothetical protein
MGKPEDDHKAGEEEDAHGDEAELQFIADPRQMRGAAF